jgi:hypothetical protein
MSQNGHNGDGGHGDSNGKKLELLTAWINPTEIRQFAPTPRQLSFQELAVRSCEEGKYSRMDWMKASREEPAFEKIPMRASEWKKWAQNPEFSSWFYDAIPAAQERDDYDKRMMDAQFWDGMQDGLREKKEWAYSIYAKVRFGNSGTKNQRSERDQLKEFIGSPDMARKWKGRPAEA